MKSKSSILLVEDNLWWAESMMRMLINEHFSVILASDAQVAIEIIDETKIDALIVDICLPGPNGIVLIHELFSHHDLRDKPVLVVSSLADDDILKSLVHYGVKAVFDKSTVTAQEVARTLRRVLA